MAIIKQFESHLLDYIKAEMTQDLAHDINHVLRVVKSAKQICIEEQASMEVVLPAAYLHDCFSFAKDHPKRKQSSTYAADKAIQFLKSVNYPAQYLEAIHHAIEAHSYSANIITKTIEAQIVQDADRLDALGAIGIARCLQVSSTLSRPLYTSNDAFCDTRAPDDSAFTLDHFYTKLLSLGKQIKTPSAQKEAKLRTQFMLAYLEQLKTEIIVENVIEETEQDEPCINQEK